MRILYITDYLPYPPVTGDLIRNFNLIRRVAAHHQVSVVGFQDPTEPDGLPHLRKFCHRVEALPLPRRRKSMRLLRMLRYQAGGVPFEFEFLASDALRDTIRKMAAGEDFDIIQIEHSRMAPYLEALPRQTRARRILTFHNVASNQYGRISNILVSPLDRLRAGIYSRVLRHWEPRVAGRFDRSLTVSEIDRQALLRDNPKLRVSCIPNGVDTQVYQPLPPSAVPNLLLTGSMSYRPNADGAIWFCTNVLPLVRRKLNDVRVSIVGLGPPPDVLALADDCVRVVGRVPDLIPYYRDSAIALVPLRAGGGTRLKVLEAMALGRPVVSTAIGCEGLDVEDGRHVIIANDPQDMAQSIARLLSNPNLYRHIAENARQMVVSHYDWDAIANRLLQVYDDVAAEAGISAAPRAAMQSGAA